MMAAALLDTSYLICLIDRARPAHETALRYYRMMLEQGIPMYLSAIVADEFSTRQQVTDLPLKNFRPLPFNIPHAIVSGRLGHALLAPEGQTQRSDIKLLAQAEHEGIPFLLAEDQSSLVRFAENLRRDGLIRTRTILLSRGFDAGAFRPDGQKSLDL